MGKRIAICGTANSWIKTPWDDPTLEIWGINDMWTLGPKRVDRWFDLHPLDRFHFRPLQQKFVYAHEVPYGCYVRPEGHLEKLQEMARTIPVYLQQTPPPGWPPNARRLPFEQLTAAFGFYSDRARGARVYPPLAEISSHAMEGYWASGPSYEVALAILEGATEIQVWGIHLSTEAEYREQKNNFEMLLGMARGRGITIVMAEESPVLTHGWQYALQPKPPMHPAKAKLLTVRQAKSDLLVKMATTPTRGAADRLRRLEAMEMDCIRAMQHREPVIIEAPVLGVADGYA